MLIDTVMGRVEALIGKIDKLFWSAVSLLHILQSYVIRFCNTFRKQLEPRNGKVEKDNSNNVIASSRLWASWRLF